VVPTKTTISIVIFEVLTAVAMKNVVFWDLTPCGSCKKRRFGGTITDALSSSETVVVISATRRNIPEEAILENLYCLSGENKKHREK
jgi:hypothetical protein